MHIKRLTLCAIIGLSAFSLDAFGGEIDRGSASEIARITVKWDNDLWGGLHQDNNYTNGFGVAWTNATTAEGALPRRKIASIPVAWLAERLRIQGGRRSTGFSIGQAIFTPRDPVRSDVIRNDRPYAGAILITSTYSVRNQDELHVVSLRTGLVGPWALGRQTQLMAHKVTGGKHFNGWGNQLNNEALLDIAYEYSARWTLSNESSQWSLDAITHWGAELGNFSTHAALGGEVRFGWNLPNDFGIHPGDSVSVGADPGVSASSKWSGHFFIGPAGTWVMHDITLDGNTFSRSHAVPKRPLIAELRYGFVVKGGRWTFTISQIRATREFDSQDEAPSYGSFTVGYAY